MANSPKVERKLAAIVFTDIVDFTKLTANDQSKALNLLNQQRELLKPIVESFNGLWVKEIGDGLLLVFDTVTDAVKCSIEIQKKTTNVDNLDLRIGIHQGEVLLEENDVIGDDVNIASRIEPFSAVGGIAISNKVNDAIVREKEFETEYIGKPKLKGVSQEVKVYCITSHGLPKTDVSTVSAKLDKDTSQNSIFKFTGAALTVLGFGFWLAVGVFDVSFGDESEVPSIAILPLNNKGAVEDEFYAYGISSDLISDVTSAGLIRVASLNEIEELGDIPFKEKAKQLFVRYVAQGTIWKRDSIFQLSMELYDTKTGKVVWSERWQKNWKELPVIRDELAENILEKLKVDYTTDIPSYASNPEAYEYYLKGKYKYEKRKNIEELEIARGLIQKSIQLDDNIIAAKILLGSTYVRSGYSEPDYESALENYTSALKRSEQLGDKMWMGRSIRKIGNISYYKGDKEKALENYQKSLLIAEELDDNVGKAACINNIGNCNIEKGNYKVALEYFDRSLALYKELDDKNSIGMSLKNIVTTYRKKGDLDRALEYSERALAIYEEIGNTLRIYTLLETISGVYKDIGDFDKALVYRKKIIAMYKDSPDPRVKLEWVFNWLGWAYFTMGEFDKSIENYNMMLQLVTKLKEKEEIANVNSILGFSYFYNENHVKALEYFEKSSKEQLEVNNEVNLPTKIYLLLTKKTLGKDYNVAEILTIVKDEEKIRNYYIDYYGLYKLLEERSYLEKAYNDINSKAVDMKDEFKEKYLKFSVQKQIIEEYHKVNS